MKKLTLGVLASGKGSNFAAILKNIQSGILNVDVGVVISNKKSAGVLDIARDNNIPACFVSSKKYPEQELFDKQLIEIFKEHNVNFIILAGYLKMMNPEIIKLYHNRILNIHPALLPAFGGKGYYGIKVHEAVLKYGCKISGVTVHLVDETYDTGTPVMQRTVPVKDDDTPESLAARVLKVEHSLFSEAIFLFAENRVEICGRKVIIKPSNK